jgi:hypothetical protein
MKNWLPFVSGPDASTLERRLLAVLPVATLRDEAGDHPVKDHVVVEALVGKVDEVLCGLGRVVGIQLDLDVTEVCGDRGTGHEGLLRYGLATVTRFIVTGSRACPA